MDVLSEAKKVIHVVGARPNYMKAVPVIKRLSVYPRIQSYLLHTGQHYDKNLSDIFFKELDAPHIDFRLSVSSSSGISQFADIMKKFEKIVKNVKPDLVIVYGDINSTLACALTAKKLNIKVAHVEAGLRSRDLSMPEEVNRILTDAISDILFTPSPDADMNLVKEGVLREKIHFVGNVMIDSLVQSLPKIEESNILARLGLSRKKYCVLTLHRPSNVDEKNRLDEILGAFEEIALNHKIVFPLHPRTAKNFKSFYPRHRLWKAENFYLIDPLGYLDFMKLVKESFCVLTDSGGIQEETTFLKVPCLTIRENTERPITIKKGTNVLAGVKKEGILRSFFNIKAKPKKKTVKIERWEGKSAHRIAREISLFLNSAELC